jgi:hypothetical protein
MGTVPESALVVPQFSGEVEFLFDEVVDERSGGQLANLIRISPRHDNVDVSWRRNRVTVRPGNGWLRGETYTVTLLPGIADLRQNRLDSTTTVIFSTGGDIPDTRVSGNVINWEAGRLAGGALVELIRPGDSVTYLTAADSSGAFTITSVPVGQYALIATIDESRNQRRELREAYDSTMVRIDSTAQFNLWAFTHDTIGPNIRAATFTDSLAVTGEFTQFLAPDLTVHSARVLLLPDSTPVAVERLMWRPAFDSLRTAQRDSIEAALLDSLAAIADSIAADSVVADSAVVDSAAVLVADSVIQQPEEPTPADSIPEPDPEAARREALLQGRPTLYDVFIVLLGEPLTPGESYVIETTVENLLGIRDTSARSLLIPTPPDST